MKKRRPCTWIQARPPKISPRGQHTHELENFPVKTKSFHDLKRRRVQRDNAKISKKRKEHSDGPSLKRDVFGSLESLFDIKKPLNLPEVFPHQIPYHKETYAVPPFESDRSRTSKEHVESCPKQQQIKLEPHIVVRVPDTSDILHEKEFRNSEIQDAEWVFEKVEKDNSIMAENEEVPQEAAEDDTTEAIQEVEIAAEESTERESEIEEVAAEPDSDATEVPIDKGLEATINDLAEAGGDTPAQPPTESAAEPPAYPLPEDAGKGIPVKLGARKESILSSSPLMDTALVNEMKEADERVAVIAKEIEQLKLEIADLTNKKDLTEEDTIAIQQKQDDIMEKLGEFEQITRRIQRLLGLSDPSSYIFAQMFNMLPYPHSRPQVEITEEPSVETTVIDDIEHECKEKGREKIVRSEDRFDLPEAQYPEDNLPRVIVCGYTEDEIPKIVVADSERKENTRCLQDLTGKLTESLTMQEKLVKENAQLEGGKYKLEEALLEKDSAVENLQRKVCGLQAEMRIVVKENTELSRQLATLNQRVTSPPCCYTCPDTVSTTISSPPILHTHTYATSIQPEDDYCRCKCCFQPQFTDTLSPGNTVCGSPRLGGGASTTEGYCLLSGASSQTGDMCCRSPAAVKTSCPGPPPRGTCPAELENKFTAYGNSTKQLEQQLGNMESEVRNMQIELANVQRERQQLEQQRKLLKCTGPCAPCSCPPPPSNLQTSGGYPSSGGVPSILPSAAAPTIPLAKVLPHSTSTTCTGPCVNAPMGTSNCPQQQLRDLREQYARLQDDYKNKLCEVSCLRADAEKLKQETRDAKEEKEKMEIKMIDAQERLKLLEAEKEKFEGYKEQLVEQEQALIVAKQRFREAQDELEELRSLIQDQASQLEDYRNKYLQAQQQVEEQRRQLDLMEMDNARMNENVTLEIGRVKNQFQEKLAELAPLPDILKQTQVKLQEAQQLRLVAERNCEDLSRELLGCKDKIQTLQNQLDVLRNEHQALQEERGHGSGKFEELERRNSELRHENERMKNTLARFEEHEAQLQKRIDEKMHEITQLTAMLEQVREDSARQVARTKERCDTVRRSMQAQIADMERQLAQCRATAKAAQKDRDEIRQKMQGQINNLNEAFEQAQGRIRSLQGHVNYLKTSYSNIFKGQGEAATILPGDTPGAGYDSCDCNY